jgi:hypothetical protein
MAEARRMEDSINAGDLVVPLETARQARGLVHRLAIWLGQEGYSEANQPKDSSAL